ncbi:MAG: hypothetical protein IJO52_02240 [Clostridia bacterium]|nr:hypothetical protein [Clostridia bacterium]
MCNAFEDLRKDCIRIGAYTAFTAYEEKNVQLVAEAGIDMAILEIDKIPEDKRDIFFEWLEKYKVRIIAYDTETRKYYKDAAMLDYDKLDRMWYKDKKAYGFYDYVDEPGVDHFDELGKEVAKFNEMFPDKIAYINLLPMYANSAQLTGGAWKAPIEYYEQPSTNFKQYIDEYIQKVPTHYICTDIYPHQRMRDPKCPDDFPAKSIKKYYPHYIKSIEVVADACRECGRDFWVCIQTSSWDKIIREPDEAELRVQAYVMLSYGAKALFYFTFAFRNNRTGTMVNVRNEKTELFFASKCLTAELKRLSDTYVSYKNLGAFNVNSDPEKTPYLEMDSPYSAQNFKTISEIKCDVPLLVGCFEKKEGKGHAFTLVNMQDFASPKDTVVKVKINGTKVTSYPDGNPSELSSADGWYEFSLPQGEGIFVTVE